MRRTSESAVAVGLAPVRLAAVVFAQPTLTAAACFVG